jgi:D-alanyl-D-alanine carboxypeptidase/D-alanyl-D-alanine-endopeptidase (penicillin-binding protein 4)
VPGLVRDAAGAALLEATLRGVLAPYDACVRVATTPLAVRVDDGRARAPASTIKLLTGAAAIERLGADHTFTTRAVAAGPIVDGTVTGDLVLVGGGDPVLSSAPYEAYLRSVPRHATDPVTRLDDLADALVAAGVRRVDGSVLGDDSRHDDLRVLPGWKPDYLDDGDVARLSALTVDDGDAAFPGHTAAPDPATHAAAVLRDLLAARGVTVTGGAGRGVAPRGAVDLASVTSPPLSAIVSGMLTSSDNQTAELLVRELAVASGGPGTTDAGTAVVREVASTLVDADDLVVLDGSGLSPGSRVTCGALLAVVQRALGDPELAPLVEGLPVAGRTGTLATRFEGNALDGRLRAKTGQIAGVVALAGVVDDPEPRAFALLVGGGLSVETGQDVQGAVATLVDRFPSVPDDAVPAP